MKKFYSIQCSGPGCEARFTTTEPVAKNATYTCKEHTGKIKTVNSADPAFQRHAFDNTLGPSVGEKPNLDRHDRNDR